MAKIRLTMPKEAAIVFGGAATSKDETIAFDAKVFNRPEFTVTTKTGSQKTVPAKRTVGVFVPSVYKGRTFVRATTVQMFGRPWYVRIEARPVPDAREGDGGETDEMTDL